MIEYLAGLVGVFWKIYDEILDEADIYPTSYITKKIIGFIALILGGLLINYDVFFAFFLIIFLVNELVSKYLHKNYTHINIHNLEFNGWEDGIDNGWEYIVIIGAIFSIYKIIKNKDEVIDTLSMPKYLLFVIIFYFSSFLEVNYEFNTNNKLIFRSLVLIVLLSILKSNILPKFKISFIWLFFYALISVLSLSYQKYLSLQLN